MTRLRLRNDSRRGWQVLVIATVSSVSTGCISIAAPEKPIEINLNINIRQEVLVKLERDVQDLIKKNPGVF